MPYFPYDSWGEPPAASPWLDAQQASTGSPVSPPPNTAFVARYPVFSGVSPDMLTAILAEAANEIDTTWRTTDQVPAIMAYAAHILVSEGLVSDTINVGGTDIQTSGPITSYAAGDTKIGFASSKTAAQSPETADLGSTIYGRRFLDLQSRNIVAAALIV